MTNNKFPGESNAFLIIISAANFILNFIQPFSDLLKFIQSRSDIVQSLSIAFFPIAYVLFADSLVFNEELLIVACFMAAVYFLYDQLGQSIQESLDERNQKIKSDLVAFDMIKLDHLNNLHKITSNVLHIQSQINDLQKFCVKSIASLDHSQKQAFVGLIAKNIVERLQVLINANKLTSSNHLVSSFNVKISNQFNASKRVLFSKKSNASSTKQRKRKNVAKKA
jgi:hypothetical protein